MTNLTADRRSASPRSSDRSGSARRSSVLVAVAVIVVASPGRYHTSMGNTRQGRALVGNLKGSSMSIADQAKRVYESRFKAELEAKHRDQFVAIEPVSESFYLGNEFIDAAIATKNAYPDRKSFIIRVGHEAAFHIGGFAF